ncbi:hypothetical protein GJAV_G00002710 [Gymnothorax javanicus]|nr:hypothetical protein GJAV_G00002710 [Gymnothorax javanicus]
MKSICIAILLLFLSICVLHSTAHPFHEALVGEAEGSYVQNEETQQATATAEATNSLVLSRTKRHQSHLSLCRYCCKCCKNKGCGFCCEF